MKKTIFWLFKLLIAALLALAITSGLCYYYYNLPVHYTNETGATDYLWNKNHASNRLNEGFALTKTDEHGFVNTYPDKKDVVDILLMGSSHTEAFNVNADENFPYLLNKKINENGGDKYAYSIGTSAHEFVRCLRNLENAVKTYKPTDCVVIETSLISLNPEALRQLNSNNYPVLSSYNSGLMYQLQKFDFFRLAYSQIKSFLEKDKVVAPSKTVDDDIEEYKQLIETAVQNAGKVGKENNCRVIILYCPHLEIDYNGNVVEQEYTEKQEIFKAACEKYGVELVDMYTPFKEMYNETNCLPHGFMNTAVGEGHTNKYGHSCIADKLYSVINEE